MNMEPKKTQKEERMSHILPDGSEKYDGDIMYEKGDIHWEDCCVTRSNDGTLSEPECLLKNVTKESIFSQV